MKQILRFKVLSLLMLTGLFCANAAPVSTLAEMKEAFGGDLTITAEHPIYVVDIDADGYYMLYDGTAGVLVLDVENFLSSYSIQKGNSITAGTFYFGYNSFIGFNFYKSPTDLVISENGTIADPIDLPEVTSRFDRGTYFKTKGTISAVEGGYKFVPEVGESGMLADYFNVGANFSEFVDKPGTFTGIITGTGTSNSYSPFTANFFEAEGEEPGDVVKTFKELLESSTDNELVNVIMPENAQILRIVNSSVYVWDGETGIQFYASGGNHSSYITNFDYSSDGFSDGYTGYLLTGSVEATFEESYWDFYMPTGSLTIGDKAELTPKEFAGADLANGGKMNYYSYVKMHGKIENGKFIADDGTEFNINEEWVNIGAGSKEGEGTLKGMYYNDSWGGSQLYIIENTAWTADPSEDDFDAPVMSIAELKQLGYDNVRFKFEQDKVVIAAVIPGEGYDQLFLWDGQDGVFLNGDILSGTDFEAKQGYVINGGLAATYQGSFSNQIYCNPSYFSEHEVHLTLGGEKNLTPVKKSFEELHATAGTTVNDYSYVAVEGTIVDGRMVSGDQEILIMNYACPNADVNKYDGQTGTFYGLYQATNGEYLLPISEFYFMKNDDPVVYPLENLTDLNAAEQPGLYNMSLTAEGDYKVQLLAYNSGVAYLWDGQKGAIVLDETNSIPADKVGAFLTGDVKFTITNNEDVIEYLIDAASIVFTEVEEFLPAVEKTSFNEGDFVKVKATLMFDETDGTVYFTIGDEDYILVDDLVAFGVEPAELNGKEGTLTAIYTGMNLLSIYPDAWFVESEPNAISLTTVTEADAARGVYTLDGRYVGNSVKNLTKGIYVVGGKKIAVK